MYVIWTALTFAAMQVFNSGRRLLIRYTMNILLIYINILNITAGYSELGIYISNYF